MPVLFFIVIVALQFACSTADVSNKGSNSDVQVKDSADSLTVDLSDDWTPYLFSENDGVGARVKNDFREAFVESANERPFASPLEILADKAAQKKTAPKRRARFSAEPSVPRVHRYPEVYGIPPTFSVLRERALQEVDKNCFREVDTAKLSAFNGFVAYTNNREAEKRSKEARETTKALEIEMSTNGFATLNEYRANAKDVKSKNKIDLVLEYEAIRETQRLLGCEGLFDTADGAVVEGGLCYATHLALLRFEQKNRIFGWGYLGGETLDALRKTPKVRLYNALVRVINERVADAAGIIEDGTATANDTTPVYRDTTSTTRSVRNLIDEFTKTVLSKLGIHSPDDGIAFLQTSAPDDFHRRLIQVDMPALPPYYREDMDLSIEIDRGDVCYDYPYERGRKKPQQRKRSPTLTLYVHYNSQRIPLSRMQTSIGGWQDETAEDGYVYLKYKNTEEGEAIIREIIAAPTWVPPESTPSSEIAKNVIARGRAVTVPNADIIGPWFTSAYGLVAAIHLKKATPDRYVDMGIRSHGSYDYTSVSKRHSHGCHRLLNHLAIRLYDFVLRHTPHRRVGQRAVHEKRQFSFDGSNFTINVSTDGYVFDLLKPIPVKTLKGNIVGDRQNPITSYMPKPDVRYGRGAMFVN